MKKFEKTIKEFYDKTGYTLEVNNGGLYYGGYLDLRGTGITSLPDGLTVGGNLDLEGTGITSLPDGLTVGGYLDLRGTCITSLPDGLTVGGNLYLEGTGITSLPDGLTVGGYLDLRGTCITSLPDGLTVGGYLDLRGTGITEEDAKKVNRTLSQEAIKKIREEKNHLLKWEWNGKTYIKIDGVFSILDSHKGNVWLVRQIGSDKQTYIVTDGEGHYAHGDTLKEARADLIYKINDRDMSAYKNLALDDELTFEDAIAAYRTITGACSAGTLDYIENRLPHPHKEKYTIREIISLTDGEYQADAFKNFFTKK